MRVYLAEIPVDFDPLIRGKDNRNLEPFLLLRCGFGAVGCHGAELLARLDPVAGARAVIVQNVAEDVGCLCEQLLCSFAGGGAVADSPHFLGFDGLDELLVVAQALPHIVWEPESLPHRCFAVALLPFRVSGKRDNELVVVEEGFRVGHGLASRVERSWLATIAVVLRARQPSPRVGGPLTTQRRLLVRPF